MKVAYLTIWQNTGKHQMAASVLLVSKSFVYLEKKKKKKKKKKTNECCGKYHGLSRSESLAVSVPSSDGNARLSVRLDSTSDASFSKEFAWKQSHLKCQYSIFSLISFSTFQIRGFLQTSSLRTLQNLWKTKPLSGHIKLLFYSPLFTDCMLLTD